MTDNLSRMAKIMKRDLNKLIKGERGLALPLVLVLLLLGGLIIAPLLGYMTTGLKAGEVHEESMERLYAADAGVEDALYQIIHNNPLLPVDLGDSWSYYLEDAAGNPIYINGNSVHVEIKAESDLMTFLENMELGLTDPGVHQEWATIGDNTTVGQYTITVTYNGSAANKFIDGVGAWLRGHYTFDGDPEDPGCPDPEDPGCPISGNLTVDFPNFIITEPFSYKGGTVFYFAWQGGNRPNFGTNPDVYARSLTFKYEPEVVPPPLHISWVAVGSEDVGTVPTSQVFGEYTIIATASDVTTGKQTQVVAYITWERSGETAPAVVDITDWEISP